jgi:lipopolysaccharide/colanic/teichoic acid biosynthesis glycosyltransferase
MATQTTVVGAPHAAKVLLDLDLDLDLDLELRYVPINERYQLAKRILDIVICLLVLIPLCVVTLVVAAVICLDSPGPVFFRQTRTGAHGEEFTCLKFRSMYADADDALHRAAYQAFISGKPVRVNGGASTRNSFGKVPNDPRITQVGRFIRKTSIDELPQVWNILLGHMTLVGPRPPLPYEVALYSRHDCLRLSGKPGLTGAWQVYGRNCVTFQQMINMDIEYLKRQSLLEDIKLILLTIPAMLRAPKGA